MNKALLTILIVALVFTAPGCSQRSGQSISIHFGEFWDSNFNISERLVTLDGERVSITGFMAMQSPLDGSFVYLTNAPMVSCPYCIPGTNTPVYAIPAIAPSQHPIKFTDQPVTVAGRLEAKEKIDEFGYTTSFRINVDSISMADPAKMPQSLRDYNLLTAGGVTTEITDIIIQVYNITVSQSDVNADGILIIQAIDIDKINALMNKVRDYGVSSFDPLINVLSDLKDLSAAINELIENDEKEKLINHSEDAYYIWETYFDWANNMAAIE